ncbi:MAG: metal-dependent hydrolase [Candidatus Aminicenantes bacterium]|nr:metal-dependent hydrolase [Candidatus Aminicenantes bacterium]
MSPIAHLGIGLLGWQVFDRKKTLGTLGMFFLAANLADIDFLFYMVFGPKPIFIHQYYTHNVPFILAGCGLLAFLLPRGRSRWGLLLTGLSHLLLDIIVIDTLKPIGMRLFFPFSDTYYNLGFFPFLRRVPRKVMTSPHNFLVLGLEFACFVLPIWLLFRRRLARRFSSRAFWRL